VPVVDVLCVTTRAAVARAMRVQARKKATEDAFSVLRWRNIWKLSESKTTTTNQAARPLSRSPNFVLRALLSNVATIPPGIPAAARLVPTQQHASTATLLADGLLVFLELASYR
jgi:hypothetical protein